MSSLAISFNDQVQIPPRSSSHNVNLSLWLKVLEETWNAQTIGSRAQTIGFKGTSYENTYIGIISSWEIKVPLSYSIFI